MLSREKLVRLRGLTVALVIVAAALPGLGASSCGGGGADTAGGTTVASTPSLGSSTATTSSGASGTSGSGATISSTSTASFSSGVLNAVQIITKGDPSGSFNLTTVPLAGGVSVRASRFYNLDGSQITVGNVPPWFVDAHVFLTSTRTSAGQATGSPAQDTPCAYFDNVVGDANPDTSGYYTVDGYNTTYTANDIDQCAGVAAGELSQIGMYLTIDRRFMNSTDKLQLIVKASPIDAPNMGPTPSSCVSNGFFDPTVCSNQLYTVSMRSSPGASAKPFYILFPSAKAFDLLSESVLLPVNNDQSITTISIDRVKGGAIFYGLSVVRLP